MITSPHNDKLKLIRRLGRRRTRDRDGLFVGEGEDLLAAARAAGREGLPDEVLAQCESRVTIPLREDAESLNVAAAAAIALQRIASDAGEGS